jgi:hypothetical protein
LEYNTLKVKGKYLLKNIFKLITMKNRQDKLPCKKCGKMILPSTAERYQGKCAPCAKKANEKWYKPLLSGLVFVFLVVIWPFFLLEFCIMSLYFMAATFVPNTKANLKARMMRGWMPDWAIIQKVWSKAPRVYAGPIGPGAEMSTEYLILKKLSEDRSVPSTEIRKGIDSKNPILAAYSMLALLYRGEREILTSLPTNVFESDEQLEYQVGCLVGRCTLREFGVGGFANSGDQLGR